jgi:hypothetical protein
MALFNPASVNIVPDERPVVLGETGFIIVNSETPAETNAVQIQRQKIILFNGGENRIYVGFKPDMSITNYSFFLEPGGSYTDNYKPYQGQYHFVTSSGTSQLMFTEFDYETAAN